MRTAYQIPAWLRSWHVVYLMLVLAALGRPSGAAADDAAPFGVDGPVATPARPRVEETQWIYSRTLRLELARGKHLRVETTLPLDRVEEPRLKLSVAKKLSRSWAVEFAVWTSL